MLLKLLPSLVIKGTRDLNLQGWCWSHRLEIYVGNLKCELKVHVRASPHQRSLRSLELSLIAMLDLLRIDILDYKSQFDIVDCFQFENLLALFVVHCESCA